MSIFKKVFGLREESRTRASEQPVPAPEKEASPEVQAQINQIDGKIEASQEFLSGLGKLAKDRMFAPGTAEYDKIYAPKELGRTELNVASDARAFAFAESGLVAKNRLSFGLLGRKDLLGGAFDTRKLRNEADENRAQKLSVAESMEAAEELGMNREEGKRANLSKAYVKSGERYEKVILGEKTEAEVEAAAGKILSDRLSELERAGAGVAADKANLEKFEKELASTRSVFEPEDIERLEAEKQTRRENLDGKKQELDDNLEIIRGPLLEHQQNLNEMLSGYSALLAETSSQEKSFKTRVKQLQDNMNKISRTQIISTTEVAQERKQRWEEEQNQAQVNLDNLAQAKLRLSQRINELKIILTEMDRTLVRINKISKRPEELNVAEGKQLKGAGTPIQPDSGSVYEGLDEVSGEEEEAMRFSSQWSQEKDEAEREKEAEWQRTMEYADENYSSQERPAEKRQPASQPETSQAKQAAGATEEPDNYENQVAAERELIESDQEPKLDETGEEIRGGWFGRVRKWFKPVGGIREPKKRPEARAPEAPAVKPIRETAISQPETVVAKPEPEEPEVETAEKEVSLTVNQWLSKIFRSDLARLGKEKRESAQAVITSCFALPDKAFNPRAVMNSEQAARAYANYLMEFAKHNPKRALDIARGVIKQEAGVEVEIPYLEETAERIAEKPETPTAASPRVKREAGEGRRPARRGNRPRQPIAVTESRAAGSAKPFNGLAGQLEAAQEEAKLKNEAEGKGKKRKPRQADTASGSARRKRLAELDEEAADQELREAAMPESPADEAQAAAAEAPVAAPTTEAVAATTRAEAKQKEKTGGIKWSVKRWTNVLGPKFETPEEKQAFKKHFQPSPKTVDEAVEVYKKFKAATSGPIGEQLISIAKKNIEQAVAEDNK